MSRIVQEAEFADNIRDAAEKACAQYEKDKVCIYSGRYGTLIFPDEATAFEGARAAATKFDLFAYQLGLNIDLSAIEGAVKDCCVSYYRTYIKE